jgi:hypothetical protein
MPEFQIGDIVRVELPRGYSNRGILGISVLFNTSPESRFEGAIGTVMEINPAGPQSVHQYLVDFRTHDNSRIGIPWQAQWFREEWLALQERPEAVTRAPAATATPEATWPERPAAEHAAESAAAGGIAHPEAKIYTEGKRDFAPEGMDPGQATGTVPASAYGIGGKGESPAGASEAGKADQSARAATAGATGMAERTDVSDQVESGTATSPAESPEATTSSASSTGAPGIVEQGDGFVRVTGMTECPEAYPIKGNENSGIYHVPGISSYARTIAEICFESEEVAVANGYRPPRGRQSAAGTESDTSQGFTGPDRVDDRSALDAPTFEPTPESMTAPVAATTPSSAPGMMPGSSEAATTGGIIEQGEGFVRVDGSQRQCPEGYPVKGNANSGIYHLEGMSSYDRTIPEICFDSAATAEAQGYRAPRGRQFDGKEITERPDTSSAGDEMPGEERDPGKFYASPESVGAPSGQTASAMDESSDSSATVAEPIGLVSDVTVGSTIIASETPSGDLIVERGEGFVRVRGMTVCPDGFPIKGNASSGIFHAPSDHSYQRTIPEICFASEDSAIANGFRAPSRRG